MADISNSSQKDSRILYVLAGVLGVALICVGICFFVSWRMNAPRQYWYDCLALMEDNSVVVLSGTTKTAYRSNDDGITWSRDSTIDGVSTLNCGWNWPVTVRTEPPIIFYYIGGSGIYQSLDGGETLALVPPFDPGEVKSTPNVIVTQSDTLIIFIGDGELWLRLPSGEWIRYKERFHKLQPAPK